MLGRFPSWVHDEYVRKYMQSDNFENTRNRYFEFPKISFAYEVVEK